MSTLPPPEQDPISGVSVVNMLLRNRYLVAGTALLLAFLVGVLLLLPARKYTAESSFMSQSRNTLPANISGIASQFGFALPTGEASQSPAFYAELLQSREILAAVVDSPIALQDGGAVREAPLSEWLKVSAATAPLQRDKTISRLKRAVDVGLSVRTGVVTLRVTTKNPELSARINERMLSWLNEFNLQKRQSQASAERKFTEDRLDESRQELRVAEERLLAFTQRNRDTRNSPLLSLEDDRLKRDVAMRQQVYTSVVQAYDRAKIEEVRDTPVLTVLQVPEVPVRPDSRGILTKVILMLIVGTVLGVWLAMTREALRPHPATFGTARAEFDALVSEFGNDLRHPFATLGRLVRRTDPSRGSTRSS